MRPILGNISKHPRQYLEEIEINDFRKNNMYLNMLFGIYTCECGNISDSLYFR